jgi:hypothetical protein
MNDMLWNQVSTVSNLFDETHRLPTGYVIKSAALRGEKSMVCLFFKGQVIAGRYYPDIPDQPFDIAGGSYGAEDNWGATVFYSYPTELIDAVWTPVMDPISLSGFLYTCMPPEIAYKFLKVNHTGTPFMGDANSSWCKHCGRHVGHSEACRGEGQELGCYSCHPENWTVGDVTVSACTFCKGGL